MVAAPVAPPWLTLARSFIGTREVVGPKHSPVIMGWIQKLGAKVLGIKVVDDETAWCGTFVAFCMFAVGLPAPPIAVRASAWGDWGRELAGPRLGCILVFTRAGGGHVGFYIGEDVSHFHVLGGNQGNAVSITRIAKDRLAKGGMRWPAGVALPEVQIIRLNAAGVPVTANEA
jgi:uncharacterized protein (TIGR02594 family)